MARRTQLHIDAITASFGNVELGIVDNLSSDEAGNINAISLNSGSLVGVLSVMASAIKRLNGSTTFAGGGSGIFAAAGADFVPTTDSTYDLGASGTEWAEGHIDQVIATGLTGSLTDSAIGDGQVVYANAANKLVGEAGFSYNAATNTLVVPNLTVTAASTFITSSHTVIQDAIIGLGTSGSEGYAPATTHRGLIFGAGNLGDDQQGFYHGGSGDDRFHLGKSATAPSSGAFATIASDDYATLRLKQIEFRNGNNSITAADISGDMTLNAGGDISLDADGGNVFLKDNNTIFGLFKLDASGLIVSSSAGNALTLDSNQTNGQIKFNRQGTLNGQLIRRSNEAALVLSSAAGDSLVLDANGGTVLFAQDFGNSSNVPAVDVATDGEFDLGLLSGGTFISRFNIKSTGVHDLSGSLSIKDSPGLGGSVRFVSDNGTNFVKLIAPDGISDDVTYKLPGVDGSDGYVIKTDGNGNLSFTPNTVTTTKAIVFDRGEVAAGSEYSFATVTKGSAITDLTLSDAQGSNIELYVGGQMQLSGSEAERAAGNADYALFSTESVKFSYTILSGTVVQLVKR